MKNLFAATLLLCVSICYGQYNYGLEVEQQDAKIEGKLNLVDGGNSVFIGRDAGREDDQSLNGNVYVGVNCGTQNTSGNSNSFLGYYSGYFNNTGKSNTFMGFYAGIENRTGSYNFFGGARSGLNNIDGSFNVFCGFNSGYSNTSGSTNVFIGNASGYNNTTGRHNIFIGQGAGYNNTGGSTNLAIGQGAGYNINDNSYDNVLLGYQAGTSVLGHENVLLGAWTGVAYQGSKSVFIGNRAGNSEANDERLYVENSDSSTPLIYGEFDNDKAGINWDSTMPLPATLSVNGTLHISETAKLEPQSTAPTCANGDMGTMYVNITGALFFCDGTDWKTVQLN